MTAEEAAAVLAQREAERTAASTRPDSQETAELRSVIHDLTTQNSDLQQQNIRLRRLVPEAPRIGFNFSRIRNAAFARTLATGDVFNVSVDGKLQPGTAGQRVELTTQSAGIPLVLANGQLIQTMTQQHAKLAQVALYDVFVNNNTPYDPTVDAKTNIRRMTDAYVVLVNVDTGYLDFADRSDDIWTDVFDNHPREETTIIMQETTTVIIHETPN